MSTNLPAPLRLAFCLESSKSEMEYFSKKAAEELRRLYHENEQLRRELEAVGAGGVGPLMRA